jgi:hypothetical protein
MAQFYHTYLHCGPPLQKRLLPTAINKNPKPQKDAKFEAGLEIERTSNSFVYIHVL